MADAPDRRRFLQAISGGVGVSFAGCAQLFDGEETPGERDGTPTVPPETPTETEPPTDTPIADVMVGLETVVEGIGTPTSLTVPPDDPDRLYVANREGVIFVYDVADRRLAPFLDIAEAVLGGGERGLLGLALHPEFADNRRFFIRYSGAHRPGTPDGFSHTFVLSEFQATPDGMRARPASERPVLEIPQPQETHNAGDLAFGSDGFLYVPTGDGGGSTLGHATDWYGGEGPGNGQDTTENLLGGLLRIDVDDTADDRPYGIPDDNPLVGAPGHLDEYYAWGLRNPWRISVDEDEVYVGDVGAARWEAIYRVESGSNFGWGVKEGSHCFRADDCPDQTPPEVRGGEPLVDPIIEYPNDRHLEEPISGSAVVCGYHYRGSAIPALEGRFVFADWQAGGELFAGTPTDDGFWPIDLVGVADADRPKLHLVFGIERITPDEWYVLTLTEEGSGSVHRLTAAESES